MNTHSSSSSGSKCRQNFPAICEELLNAQINAELSASYAYFSMYAWCGEDETGLPGLKAYYKDSYEEELEHAHAFTSYLLERGGKLTFTPVNPYSQAGKWTSALQTLEHSLELEKHVNSLLLTLAAKADEVGDQHLAELIQGEFLKEQIEGQKKLSDMITQLKRAGSEGLGLYIFDQDLLRQHKA
jgi:ferritin heavy chain